MHNKIIIHNPISHFFTHSVIKLFFSIFKTNFSRFTSINYISNGKIIFRNIIPKLFSCFSSSIYNSIKKKITVKSNIIIIVISSKFISKTRLMTKRRNAIAIGTHTNSTKNTNLFTFSFIIFFILNNNVKIRHNFTSYFSTIRKFFFNICISRFYKYSCSWSSINSSQQSSSIFSRISFRTTLSKLNRTNMHLFESISMLSFINSQSINKFFRIKKQSLSSIKTSKYIFLIIILSNIFTKIIINIHCSFNTNIRTI